MKKIFTVLIMVFGLSAVFAYEPKKECFKVYTTLVTYKEEVRVEDDVLYKDICLDDNRCLTRYLYLDTSDFKYEAEDNYLSLLNIRNKVELLKKSIEIAKQYKKDFMVEFYEKCIEEEINEAVYEIPFVTRENFYKISKRKYMKMFISYMETLKKQVNK